MVLLNDSNGQSIKEATYKILMQILRMSRIGNQIRKIKVRVKEGAKSLLKLLYGGWRMYGASWR